jgi:hypothetical protein
MSLDDGYDLKNMRFVTQLTGFWQLRKGSECGGWQNLKIFHSWLLAKSHHEKQPRTISIVENLDS